MGYTLEYQVKKGGASSLAEMKVDINSAGHWFGGGACPRHN
jgi:hypothetical protein